MKKDIMIWVYSDWEADGAAQHKGILTVQRIRGKEIYSLEYNES